jgi:hypothetical protein
MQRKEYQGHRTNKSANFGHRTTDYLFPRFRVSIGVDVGAVAGVDVNGQSVSLGVGLGDGLGVGLVVASAGLPPHFHRL